MKEFPEQADPFHGGLVPTGGTPEVRPSGVISNAVIGEAWALLRPSLGPWAAATAFYGLILLALYGAEYFISTHPAANLWDYALANLVISLLQVAVGLLAQFGTQKMALEHAKTGRAQFGNLFRIFDLMPAMLIVTVLYLLAVTLGSALCCLPGLYAMFVCCMAFPLVLEARVDGMQAMKKSWTTVSPQWWPMVILQSLASLLCFGGLLLCGVGFLVTLPLFYLIQALVYRDLYGFGPLPSPPEPSGPVAPIAHPGI